MTDAATGGLTRLRSVVSLAPTANHELLQQAPALSGSRGHRGKPVPVFS